MKKKSKRAEGGTRFFCLSVSEGAEATHSLRIQVTFLHALRASPSATETRRNVDLVYEEKNVLFSCMTRMKRFFFAPQKETFLYELCLAGGFFFMLGFVVGVGVGCGRNRISFLGGGSEYRRGQRNRGADATGKPGHNQDETCEETWVGVGARGMLRLYSEQTVEGGRM